MTEQPAFTKEEIALARKTTCRELNDEQMELFMFKCKRYGAHILDGQLYPTLRTDKRTGKQTLAVIVGIDFMRTAAARTGEHVGTSLPEFTGTRLKDDWRVKMKVERLVQGTKAEFWAEVRWKEYYPGKNFMWDTKEETMISKVVESHCMRKGFPVELAGLYTHEEMAQSEKEQNTYTQAMTQEFPEGVEMEGVLDSLVFPDQGQPGVAMILTKHFATPMRFQVIGGKNEWLEWIGERIVFTWGKPAHSKAGTMAIASMRRATPLSTFTPEPQAPLTTTRIASDTKELVNDQTPDPDGFDDNYEGTGVSDDLDNETFEIGRTIKAVCTNVRYMQTAKMTSPKLIVEFECADGSFEAESWHSLENEFKLIGGPAEIMHQLIWITVEALPDFRGKKKYGIVELEKYPLRAAPLRAPATGEYQEDYDEDLPLMEGIGY